MSKYKPTTIITVTYNASHFIERFAQSVAKLMLQNDDLSLVVVDNASNDDTVLKLAAVIEAQGLKSRARLRVSDSNLGFGKGCNLGAAEAQDFSPQYLWFLNPDTEVEQSAFEYLIEGFTRHTTDFSGSALRNEKGEIRSGAFRFPTITTVFLSNAKLRVLDRFFGRHTNTIVSAEPCYADWLTGASFMVRSTTFKALSGFDPQYFLYFEEVDLFLRAKRAGYKALFCPKSVVFHESGASTGMNTKQTPEIKPRPKYWYESRRYFYWERYGRCYFFAVDFAFFLGQLILRVKSKLSGKPLREPPGLLKSTFFHSALFGPPPAKQRETINKSVVTPPY